MSENRSTESFIPIMTTVAVTALILAIVCTFQLQVTEVAVVTTFGKPKVLTRPGLNGRMPWPIQRIVRFDKRKQLLTGSYRETTTRDNTNVIVKLFATWQIADPLLFFNSVGDSREAELILKSLIASQQESVLRSHNLSEFLSAGSEDDNLSTIEAELLKSVAGRAKISYGIEIDFIGFAQISLHESNSESVLSRMKQEQAKTAARIRSEGEKEAKIIRDNADSKKEQMIARAEAEAKRIRGEALITAAEQYEVFNEDLDFAIFLRKLDALEETMKTRTTVILDPRTPPYDLLKSAPIRQDPN